MYLYARQCMHIIGFTRHYEIKEKTAVAVVNGFFEYCASNAPVGHMPV